MKKSIEIKALNTYYEMANAEYDRMLSAFDQIDNKIGFLVAAVVAIPIAAIGFSSQLKAVDFNTASLVFGALGLLAFLGAGFFIIRAIQIKVVKYGIPYKEFSNYSKEYEDDAMKEWVADALIESSEFNYQVVMKKAKNMQKIFPYLIAEVLFLLAGIISVLIGKL